jgi:deoxycytidylate deaminase
MSKVMQYFSMATEAAKNNSSTHCSKHGAVLVKGGKVIGHGANSIYPHPKILGPGTHCHAEISSIKDCLTMNKSMRSQLSFLHSKEKQRGLHKISKLCQSRSDQETTYSFRRKECKKYEKRR